jgi:chromosome segregation ATPase
VTAFLRPRPRVEVEASFVRYVEPMDDETTGESLRDRLARQGEDTLGKLAQELLENPIVSGTISRAFEARERASQAQEAAMGALNLPSAADIERLTRRLRSVSQRLEGIEDGVDRLDGRLEGLNQAAARATADDRLAAIESQLAKLTGELHALHASLDHIPPPVPREQERLEVDEPAPAPAPKPTPARKPRRRPAATG